MGLVLIGTVVGLIGMVMALLAGHPFWLALLTLSASGTVSVLILAATTVIRVRVQNRPPPTPQRSI